MMRIRLFFIFFVAMFQMLLATQSKAQCTGDFRIVASYDSNGQKCTKDVINTKIYIISTNVFGTRQARVTLYNPFGPVGDLTFEYSGYNNGWYIYRCDVAMSGTNWLYLNRDGKTARLKLSFMKDKYNEYSLYVKENDVDRGPTYYF